MYFATCSFKSCGETVTKTVSTETAVEKKSSERPGLSPLRAQLHLPVHTALEIPLTKFFESPSSFKGRYPLWALNRGGPTLNRKFGNQRGLKPKLMCWDRFFVKREREVTQEVDGAGGLRCSDCEGWNVTWTGLARRGVQSRLAALQLT